MHSMKDEWGAHARTHTHLVLSNWLCHTSFSNAKCVFVCVQESMAKYKEYANSFHHFSLSLSTARKQIEAIFGNGNRNRTPRLRPTYCKQTTKVCFPLKQTEIIMNIANNNMRSGAHNWQKSIPWSRSPSHSSFSISITFGKLSKLYSGVNYEVASVCVCFDYRFVRVKVMQTIVFTFFYNVGEGENSPWNQQPIAFCRAFL